MFAHDDDVTCVRFVPDTHLFFSCGKDGVVKQWDADKFLLIQVLKVNFPAISTSCGYQLFVVITKLKVG